MLPARSSLRRIRSSTLIFLCVVSVVTILDGRHLHAASVGVAVSQSRKLDSDESIALQDGRYLFLQKNADGTQALARLNGDGTPDKSFAVGFSLDPARDYVLLATAGGKIFLVADGEGESLPSVIGLDINGVPTAVFALPKMPGNSVSSVQALADGKIAIALTDSEGTTTRTFQFFPDGHPDSASAGENPFASSAASPATTATNLAAATEDADDGGLFPPPDDGGGGVIVRPTPSVSVLAARSKIFSGSKTPGKFILRRTGDDLSEPLRVVYQVTGSAQAGRDYRPVSRVRVIGAGQQTARILIRPVGECFGNLDNGHARVTVTLLERPAYLLDPNHAAKIKMIDPWSMANERQ